MRVWSGSFTDGGALPAKHAFSIQSEGGDLGFSSNINPEIAWDELPKGTRSLVLTCVDKFVPVDMSKVNAAGETIAASAPRRDFYHWIVANINPELQKLHAGCSSEQVTVGGRHAISHVGFTEGLNDYTSALQDDPNMGGQYYGYDGPFPPLNDEQLHWYEFTLYALAIDELTLPQGFSASDVVPLLSKHSLASASIKASYSYSEAKTTDVAL